MNRILRSLSLACLLAISMVVAAQRTLTLGYCNDEITNDDYRLSLRSTSSIMAAVRIPGSRLGALKGTGAKITKIRIGAEASMTSVYVWVRPSLTGAASAIQRLGTTKEGWNEVTLASPYEITGDDIYIGFSGTLPSGHNFIFSGLSNPNGAYVSVGGTWDNLYGSVEGSLCIQAVVESDATLPTNDLGIEDVTMDDKYARNGDAHTFHVSIANYGSEPVAVPTLHYLIDGGKEGSFTPDDATPIAANEVRSISFNAPIEDLPEGDANVRVWFDGNDDYAANDSYTKSIFVFTTSYPHKMLMEQFTTLACRYCPLGDALLRTLSKNHDDVVWVAHHVGFGTDQFTAEASEYVMDYGVTSAPRAMFDRSIISLSENGKPAFSTGYELSVGVPLLAPEFDALRKRPAFVSVGIESQYDKTSRQLTLKVSGERNGLFAKLYKNASLTVYLVEDSCVSRIAQTGGAASDTIHNHVLRECLTDYLGTPITWNGDSYEQEFTTTLPDEYDVDNLKVVAFVNRPLSEGYANCEVLNCEQLDVATQATGIGSATIADENVVSRSYYNLQGQRLSQAPSHGVYVERVVTARGVTSSKHIKN